METMENTIYAPTSEKQLCTAIRQTKKSKRGRMTVDEYINLVRKALDKRYENLQG